MLQIREVVNSIAADLQQCYTRIVLIKFVSAEAKEHHPPEETENCTIRALGCKTVSFNLN